MLGSWYAYAAASNPNKVPYDLGFWRAGASVAGTALSAWLIFRRSAASLPAAAATAVGTVALGALNKRKTGSYVTPSWPKESLREKVFKRVMPVAHAVESVALVGAAACATVSRVRKVGGKGAISRVTACAKSAASMAAGAVASRALKSSGALGAVGAHMASHALGAVGARAVPRAIKAAETGLISRSLKAGGVRTGPLIAAPWYPRVRKLGLYYMTFCMLGHWVEMAFCMGIKHGIIKGGYDRENHMLWDQWLFPFPAEGTAAVLADLILVPTKNAIQKITQAGAAAGVIPHALATPLAIGASFLANQAICTSVDYGTGMVANRNYELWDYRDMRFNFQGQICLQNSLFYSILATWGVWQLLPALEKALNRASDTTLDGLLVGMGSVFAFLALLYHVIPPFANDDESDVGDAGEASEQA